MSDNATNRPLSDELLAPLGPLAGRDPIAFHELAAGITRQLADRAVPRIAGKTFRITDHDVRMALAPQNASASTAAFGWSARTARRALGLIAVRSLQSGATRSPTEAVRAAIAAALYGVRESERPLSPMDRWLAGLPDAGLAVVQAEAITWATRLWCALDWHTFEESAVIGRDHWWDSPHSSLLAIRSRAEVRSVVLDPAGQPFSVHLVVLGGPRRPTIRSELSAVAMVEALLAPRSLPPGRIVGWWPDSGHQIKVEVNRSVVEEGVAAVVHTLGRAAPPTRFEGATRAAA